VDERTILEQFPLPIARGFRRYRNALESRERHDAAFYLFEIYLKYLASVAIAHYLAGEARDHRVNAALKGLARPSLGEWLRFLRECLRFLAGCRDLDPAVTAMAALFERREGRWKGVLSLHNALRSFLEGRPGEKETVSLEHLLNGVVAYRNRVIGHGAPLDTGHYRRFAEQFAGSFSEILEESSFLTARRLVSFHALRVRDGTRVECEVLEFMGHVPLRREKPLVLSYGSSAPREEVLHLLDEAGRFVCIDPLMVSHGEDVYLLTEAEGAPEYLSYATGERHRPSGLVPAQGELFERILGYRVDATRLSKIGEEVVQAARIEPQGPGGDGGQRLGDYQVVREVGRGGMGTVFEAVQDSLGRRVALKVLPGTFALDPRRVERFRREARATARIHHPNIVPVYEVGESGGSHYYAMEFIDGSPLDQILDREREAAGARGSRSRRARRSPSTPDPAYVLRSVEQVAAVAEGLEQAHRLGLIHRDVKPSNILADVSGRWVLVDFGLVHETEANALTLSGEMVGTLNYMSPEQVSRRPVDARADIYGLGLTLYEALTLRAPFDGKSDHELPQAILFEEPPPPRRLNPRLSRDLETVVLKALEKNPNRRYQSARELADDLRRYLRGEPIRARPVSAIERVLKWAARRPTAAALAVLTGILLAASTSFGLWYWDSHGRVKVEYYANLVKRWGVPEGIGGVGEAEARHRQITYKLYRRGGRVERVDAVNGLGFFTGEHEFTPPMSDRLGPMFGHNRESRWEYKRNEDGELTEEVARNVAGTVIWIFHYTTKATGHFTDERGFPRPRAGSGATYVEFVWSDAGFEKEVRYLDRNRRPRPDQEGTFAKRLEHDARGLVVAETQLGNRGQPVQSRQGYGRTTRAYDDHGNLVEEAFLDLEGRATLVQIGYARRTISYDRWGNRIGWRQFGPDGKPVTDGRMGGKAVASRLTYDDRGRNVQMDWLDAEGNICESRFGMAGVKTVYDARGNMAEWSIIGLDGKPSSGPFGAATMRNTYDDAGNVIEWAYFGVDGKPIADSYSGSARQAMTYDERGNNVSVSYFGVDGQPTLDKMTGCARQASSFDERGNMTETAYFGVDGKPTPAKGSGAARSTMAYDDRGNMIETAQFGIDGNRALNNRGIARTTQSYDEDGNLIEEAHFGPDDRPTEGKLGYARVTFAFDKENRLADSTYYGVDGKPVETRVMVPEDATAAPYWSTDLRPGDVLVSYDGQPIACRLKLMEVFHNGVTDQKPRELRILREGKPLTLSVPAGSQEWQWQLETRGVAGE
jgi:YD repeat-containing protein